MPAAGSAAPVSIDTDTVILRYGQRAALFRLVSDQWCAAAGADDDGGGKASAMKYAMLLAFMGQFGRQSPRSSAALRADAWHGHQGACAVPRARRGAAAVGSAARRLTP
jgi:hypothetical protein